MIEDFRRDLGSFRDPSGYVFSNDRKIIRSMSSGALSEFEAARNSGLIQTAIDQHLLIDFQEAAIATLPSSVKGARGESLDNIIEHPRIPLITYPYEWTFLQLQDAALQHLNLQILALQHGFELSDASAYNMQFEAATPLHIDILSLRRYRDGRPWEGYGQFCSQFLFPLLMESELGLPFQRGQAVALVA